MRNTKKPEMRLNQPLVSIQIITRDRANFLPLAIESALNQTYRNIELIIVDSNSTDGTEELVAKYMKADNRIKYFRIVENQGITKTRNLALAKSSGEYVAILDSDDFWLTQNKIEKQVNFLENNPDHAVIGTNILIVNEHNQKIELDRPVGKRFLENDDIKEMLLINNQLTHSSTLIRTSSLKQIGAYNEKYAIWEDYELFLRLGRTYKLANLKEQMTAYRKHGGNISNTSKIKNLFILGKIIFENRQFYPKMLTSLVLVFLRMLATFTGKY